MDELELHQHRATVKYLTDLVLKPAPTRAAAVHNIVRLFSYLIRLHQGARTSDDFGILLLSIFAALRGAEVEAGAIEGCECRMCKICRRTRDEIARLSNGASPT